MCHIRPGVLLGWGRIFSDDSLPAERNDRAQQLAKYLVEMFLLVDISVDVFDDHCPENRGSSSSKHI